jgi:DNA-binding MarR family transcriptional regulator
MTPQGERVFERALQGMRKFNAQALAGVSAEDQDQLRATLRAVLANITGSDDRAEAISDMRRAQG